MVKKKEKVEFEEGLSPIDIMQQILNDSKDDHYNFEESIEYKVSSGSFKIDYMLGGGFGAGLHRFFGPYETGKTSEALEVMKNFLVTVPYGRGIYFKAEGRLTPEMKLRSGIKFVSDVKLWEDGTCFVVDSNIYDFVANMIRSFVLHDTSRSKYCFILDSVDGLIPKKDVGKSFTESQKVAGGAVIASVLMKEIALPLVKRGHMAIFISQNRSSIQLDQWSKAPSRKEGGTGGNALLHFPNWMIEFESQSYSDAILKNPNEKFNAEKNPAIGHYAKVKILKSPNETTNTRHSYPIKYGRTVGRSIWIEKELVELLLSWGKVVKSGSWYSFSDSFANLLRTNELISEDTSLKFQGEDRLFKFIEDNEPLIKFLVDYFNRPTEELLSEV